MDLSKRQIEIIQAATKIIGDKGIQNLTTKNLAAEMGFSEPALYRHFKGKTDILVSVLKFYKESLQKGMSEIILSNESGLDRLGRILKFQFNHFSKNPAIVMVIFAETSFQYEKELSNIVLEILNKKKRTLEKIIIEGQEDGSIRKDVSPEHISSIFMGGMRFTILKWRLNDYNFELNTEADNLAKAYRSLFRVN